MTVQAGKDAVFELDNAAGTLTDITEYLTEIGFPQEPEQLETTHIGSQEKSYIQGFIGAGISLGGHFDGDPDAIYDIIATGVAASGSTGQKRTFRFWPHGKNASGGVDATHPRYIGESVILSHEVTTGAADIVGFTSNVRIDGTVTRETA